MSVPVHFSIVQCDPPAFEVDIGHGFHQDVIAAIQKLPSSQRRYNTSRKWTVTLTSHTALCQALSDISKVKLKPIPETIVQYLLQADALKPADRPLTLVEAQKTVPATLFDSLLPFQRDGLAFAIEKRGCVLIADEMGCGKTIQALSVCSYYHEEWPMLVIAPSSVRSNWVEEIHRWLLLPKEDILLAKTANTDLTKHSVVSTLPTLTWLLWLTVLLLGHC
jgi:SWI/SNF-related matrix-associated actin-dependent regulator 1 of chromatin subfamily A